jgi:hypothetical protein
LCRTKLGYGGFDHAQEPDRLYKKAPIMSIASQNETTRDRTAMIHQAFWLEYLTLAWMTVEAAVAVASGIAANSLTLVAFGIDSVIELASAGLLVWRLTVELRRELRRGQMFAESAERKASRIGGGLLFVLAAYVVASAGWKLWTRQGAEFSLPGLILCVLAVPIMYFLSRRKLGLAETLGSRALKADAAESTVCKLANCFRFAKGYTHFAEGDVGLAKITPRHKAINSFRASATTITFRMRRPVPLMRSRNQLT